MADVPTNQKLWGMVVFQAKAKYHTYPSPGASNWVHKRYVELGGKFEETSEKTAREKAVEAMKERLLKEKMAHNDHSATDKKIKKSHPKKKDKK